VAEARTLFMRAGIACYEMPEQAAAAIGMLQRHARNRAELTEAPPAASPLDTGAPDVERARALVRQALASGRELLTEPEAKAVCEAYRIPVADASARLEGFSAPAMARRPRRAGELIVGAGIDPVFGPVILFGQGGAAGEALRDRAVALPPLNEPLARALIGRTRVGRRLQSGPDAPPADLDAVVATLQAVSQLLADVPEVAELELNPLRVNRQGVIALGVRLRVSRQRPAGAAHFAIRPYPSELVETLDWRGQRLTLRPVRPEDEARHLAFLRSLDRESIRLRLFHSRRAIERSELARMVQIDYAREMAFVATTLDEDGQERTLGVVRALADPGNAGAEFSILVRPDARGAGLGRILMDKLIGYQRAASTGRLTATVLADNQRMRQLGHILGFADQPTPGDVAMRELTLPLQPASKPPARGMRETFAKVFQPLALPWPKAEGD
jgi:acetyltransferase